MCDHVCVCVHLPPHTRLFHLRPHISCSRISWNSLSGSHSVSTVTGAEFTLASGRRQVCVDLITPRIPPLIRAHTHISLPHVLEQLFPHCRVRRASLSCTRARTPGFRIEPPVRFQHCNECGKLVKLPCRTHSRDTNTQRERETSA